MSDAINREDVIRIAKESGFKACVGTTDKEGNYHPFVNALGKDIPIEWLERFAALAALRAQPDHSEPFATMSITDDTGVIFSGLPSETVFKPGEKFHLFRVNSLEGKTK